MPRSNSDKGVSALIRQRLGTFRPGEVFTSKDFLDIGSRAAIDQALSRLVRAGEIDRAARGIFAVPQSNPFVGKVPPSPEKIVLAIARTQGTKVEVDGAEAARYFGLSTQVPMRAIFNTTGTPRRFKMGNQEITMRSKRPRKLALAGTLAGKALAALWYVGKAHVTPDVIRKIHEKLPPAEFQALLMARNEMPAWMSEAIRTYLRQPT